jgi:protein-S-isoprenylcysteine O-methyltransferase Ste14
VAAFSAPTGTPAPVAPTARLVVNGFHRYVRWYEEPTLARTFGSEYDTYRAALPVWIPRLRLRTPA